MSEKYKEAMDKIVLSDELKSKIKAAAMEKLHPAPQKPKHSKAFYLRCGVGYAACLLLCVLAVSVVRDFTGIWPENDVLYQASPAPLPSATDGAEQPPENTAEEKMPDNSDAETAVSSVQTPQNVIQKPHADREQIPHREQAMETDAPQMPENDNPLQTEDDEYNAVSPSAPPPGDDMVANPVNPSIEYENLSNISEQLGYDFKVPQYLPEGYELETADLLFGSLVQVSYQSEDDDIVYRTEKTDINDISGDYNIYDMTETEQINNMDATLKGSGGLFYTAIWNEGGSSYSLTSQNGLDKNTMVQIVERTDYPDKPKTNSTGQTEETIIESAAVNNQG